MTGVMRQAIQCGRSSQISALLEAIQSTKAIAYIAKLTWQAANSVIALQSVVKLES
jgi:hypothetical protein